MREILFRGKRVSDGKWVQGKPWIYPMMSEAIIIYAVELKMDDERETYCESVIVDPATIGQYTGQKDKNGKRIFEGDVVEFRRIDALGWTKHRTGQVRYSVDLPIFYILATTGDGWDWYDCKEIEIVGNIHDNPELIGGEGDCKP